MGGRSLPARVRGAASTRSRPGSISCEPNATRPGATSTSSSSLYQTPLWFSDHANEKMPITGPAEEMAKSIARLEDLGVTTIDLLVFGPAPLVVETAEKFATEVVASI